MPIRKSLLQFVFSGSSMRRWNDKLRPVELYEVDKQAHKMIAAFLLLELQASNLTPAEKLRIGQEVIEGGLFDYFYRLVITDIKPPVFYRIKENSKHYEQLTEWVLTELEPLVRPLDEDFWQRLYAYHTKPLGTPRTLADRILTAAHLYASKWEFNLIRPSNYFDEELRDIDESFTDQLEAMADLTGVRELLQGSGNALVRIANLCGQLRFQVRWSQTPRVPETSVLGHMFVVATFSYFISLSLGTCPSRRLNNFFCGLFHDLPELLTRDIISPVKYSVENLPSIIHEYEKEELERRILTPLLQAGYLDIVESLSYFLGLEVGNEFLQTIKDENGHIHAISTFEELHLECNLDTLSPKDGHLVKVCDALTAFMEAHTSISNGISSQHLYAAMARIRNDYKRQSLGDFHVGTLLADFD